MASSPLTVATGAMASPPPTVANDPKWSCNPRIYPPPEEIVTALQDEGKTKTLKGRSGNVLRHSFPLIKKHALKIYTNICQEFKNPYGLTKNASRGKTPLYTEFILKRRHMDVTECPPFFAPHQKDGKVYTMTPNSSHCGINTAIDSFQDSSLFFFNKKQDNRTNNDGLRLACILLDPSLCDPVSGIMSKRKNRTKSDISGDWTLHFYEMILTEKFSNPEYIVNLAPANYYDEFPDEKTLWDPNSLIIFENERDANWLMRTLDHYVKRKYKASLDRWNKDTGGGDGNPVAFADFCDPDKWLVWVFCLDLESNFFLAQSAGGRMPRHLQLEAGFDEEVSSLGEDNSGNDNSGFTSSSNRSKKKSNQIDEALRNTVTHAAKISNTLNTLNEVLFKKMQFWKVKFHKE